MVTVHAKPIAVVYVALVIMEVEPMTGWPECTTPDAPLKESRSRLAMKVPATVASVESVVRFHVVLLKEDASICALPSACHDLSSSTRNSEGLRTGTAGKLSLPMDTWY